MLFNSLEFILFFVVVLGTIIVVKHRTSQHFFLLIGSYFFFYFSSNYLLSLLVFSTVLDFYIAKAIWKTNNIRRKKTLLISSLIGNLGLLGFFKYADFAILQFNFLGNSFDMTTELPLLNLLLPIGISFYTFQTISYTVDVYRGKLEPSKSFLEFSLFVSFFSQLVAGPIVRASVFLPQLREKMNSGKSRLKQITITQNNLRVGITMIVLGFFKKIFFADNISPLVNNIFSQPIGLDSLSIILGTIGFGIQIYCDFSAYSDIAIGTALILGFKIPMNFNKPYFAVSPADFWHRWHISLSTWLRDYLYIPLGGNKKSRSRTYLNLLIVMFLGGLWHGASWNFVIWGLLHGIYLAIHKIIINKFPELQQNAFLKSKFGKIISILVVQYFVFLAWIPFRVENFDHMTYSMFKYLTFDINPVQFLDIISENKIATIFLIIFLILHYISYKKGNIIETISKTKNYYFACFLFFIVLAMLLFYDGNPEQFIYFRF